MDLNKEFFFKRGKKALVKIELIKLLTSFKFYIDIISNLKNNFYSKFYVLIK